MGEDKLDLEKYFKKLSDANQIPESNKNFSIGNFDQFSIESINNFGKGFVHNSEIFVSSDQSKLHSHSLSLLAKQFYEPINKKFNYDFFFASPSKIPIFNQFGGGHCQLLSIDLNLGSTHEKGHNEIIGEIGFINQDLGLLLAKSIAQLNQYTYISYSFGFKVEYDKKNFSAIFFLLERSKSPSEEKVLILQNSVRNNSQKIEEKSYSVSFDELINGFYNENMSQFNVNLLYSRIVNQDNLEVPLVFDLQICDFDKQKTESVTISIGTDVLKEIFYLWKDHFLFLKVKKLKNER
ncbi:hypothetical protein BpHYR1_020537 [Brachionus plicatilis]|uniref:Uncharacterized protein n=1 Tax=Brachionus plicatilis TaxID=10195 RepID=A0A3M7S885_BRAPC|nr:hypothetical protein BpHYR1_020537 [Brachionus plicatilis]